MPPKNKKRPGGKGPGTGGKPAKKISKQEKKTVELDLGGKAKFFTQLNHLLASLRTKPKAYSGPLLKELREFCEYRELNRELYPPVMGDEVLERPDNNGVPPTSHDLTPGYISAVASYGDTSFVTHPVLQVVSNETELHPPPFGNTVFGKTQQHVKITHLRLMDGDNNTMLGRLSIDITAEGKKLKPGDTIRLQLYTPLHHAIKEEEAPPKPLVYISKFSYLGNFDLPDEEEIKTPIESSGTYTHDGEGYSPVGDGDDKTHLGDIKVPKCNGKICSMYGLRTHCCIAKSHKIEEINLQTLKDECWFADEEVATMSQSHKRCMLYWWFATNIYGICGNHKRAPLPDCLVAAVRHAYPEPNGNYTEFKRYE